MICFKHLRAPTQLLLLLAGGVLLLAGCKSTPKEEGAEADKQEKKEGEPAQEGVAVADAVNVGLLLSMTFEEARAMSPNNMEIPPFYKVAADEVTVLKRDKNGVPTRVRAKGKVFLQVDFREQLIALGQEALIESGGESIVRGKPLLKRGRSVIEGLDDYTVFYIRGLRLQVIGTHRHVKEEGVTTTADNQTLPSYNVTPNWRRAWQDGPNPLLPALSPDDVPAHMRASPLLPLPNSADQMPRMLDPTEAAPPVSEPAPAEPTPAPDSAGSPAPVEPTPATPPADAGPSSAP